jgi:hypothetical protein
LAVFTLFIIHGCVLCVLLFKTVPRRFAAGFYILHVVTYLTTGSLLPFTLFDILYAALLEYFGYVERLGMSLLIISHALGSQMAAAAAALAAEGVGIGGGAVHRGPTGGEHHVDHGEALARGGLNDGIEGGWEALASKMMLLGSSEGIASMIGASEWAESLMRSWYAVLLFHAVKVVSAAWLYTIKVRNMFWNIDCDVVDGTNKLLYSLITVLLHHCLGVGIKADVGHNEKLDSTLSSS